MNLNRAEKLLELATDESTTEEERRTASIALAKMIKDDGFFNTVRKLIEWTDEIIALHNIKI